MQTSVAGGKNELWVTICGFCGEGKFEFKTPTLVDNNLYLMNGGTF